MKTEPKVVLYASNIHFKFDFETTSLKFDIKLIKQYFSIVNNFPVKEINIYGQKHDDNNRFCTMWKEYDSIFSIDKDTKLQLKVKSDRCELKNVFFPANDTDLNFNEKSWFENIDTVISENNVLVQNSLNINSEIIISSKMCV